MAYISDLAKLLVCIRCGYYYAPDVSSSGDLGSHSNPFLIPSYEQGTNGEWDYFCPICGRRIILKF